MDRDLGSAFGRSRKGDLMIPFAVRDSFVLQCGPTA